MVGIMAKKMDGCRRIEGVCYALTADGVELPVVNITHPSFALNPDSEEIHLLREKYIQELESWFKKPRFLQRMLFHFACKRSRILQGLKDAQGEFLSGMSTYLMKLGPLHMDRSFALSYDAKIAKGIPTTNVRIRLRNMAHLMVDNIAPQLQNNPARPLWLLNVGGGTAMDSLNALILLASNDRESLLNRKVRIKVFDADPRGAAFGANALEALQTPGAALDGIDAELEYIAYNWNNPSHLIPVLKASRMAISCCSSEGALIEYGSDDVIRSHLKIITDHTIPSFAFFTSISLAMVELPPLNRTLPVLQ
jgi:hypothetical protein